MIGYCAYCRQDIDYIDNDPMLDEWYEYCTKLHCQINAEGCPCCRECQHFLDVDDYNKGERHGNTCSR